MVAVVRLWLCDGSRTGNGACSRASMRALIFLLPFVGTLWLAGCPTAIDANDYDRSCDADEDCVVVADGEKCSLDRCGCGGTAINVNDLETFQTDLDALLCPNPLNDFGPVCICGEVFPVCDAGTCASTTADPSGG